MMNKDTMTEAIAISSPNGRISKRAHKAACARLAKQLFKPGDLQPVLPQTSEKERLLRQATELRNLANRGFKPRAYAKKAAELETQAAQLT